jgi:putative DNA primase/helicase
VAFAECLKQAGLNMRGGQAVRMIDLPADAGADLGAFQCLHGFNEPAALAEAVKKAAKENHGHAGPEFVRRLLAMPDRDKTLRAIFEKMRAALTPDKAAPEVARAVKRFALIATAGELATRWGFFEGCAKGGAESLLAVRFCLDAWLTARGGAGSLAEVQARDRLLDFIGKHGARFQDRRASGDERPVLNRAGFRETMVTGETVYYILPDVFQNEICSGLSHTQAARTLADMRILKRGDGKNLARNETLPELGRRRVYVVSLPQGDG